MTIILRLILHSVSATINFCGFVIMISNRDLFCLISLACFLFSFHTVYTIYYELVHVCKEMEKGKKK